MGTAQVNNIVQFGGGVNSLVPGIVIPEPSISTLLQLSFSGNTGGGGAYFQANAWKSGGGQYQVTGGKTFYGTGVWLYGGAANMVFTFGYGTASFTNATGTPPTGAVYYSSGSGAGSITTLAAGVWSFFPISILFPASDYPFLLSITGGSNPINALITGLEA